MLIMPSVSAGTMNLTIISGYPYQKLVWESGYTTSFVSDMRYDLMGGFGGYGGTGGGGAGGRDGPTAEGSYSSYVTAEQTLDFTREDAYLYFTFSRANDDYISGYVVLKPSGAFTGERLIHINEGGGADYVTTYARDPTGTFIYTQKLHFFAAVDACTNKQYFVIRESNPLIETATDWSQIFPSEYAAIIEIDSITVNPIYKVQWTQYNGQSFNVQIAAVKISNYIDSLNRATCRVNPQDDPFGYFSWLLDPLRNVITEFQKLVGKMAAFFGVLEFIGYLIFAGEIFAGVNALYIVFAAYMAVENASIDNPFGIIEGFIKNMRKLLRFYMELYKALKQVIVFWTN